MKAFASLVGILCGLALAAPVLAAEPCQLITQAEAAKVLGEAVKPGAAREVVGMASGHSCGYFTAAPISQRGGTGALRLTVYSNKSMAGGMFDGPKEFFERMREVKGKRVKVEDVEGLGSAAFWEPGAYTLNVSTDQAYFTLKVADLAGLKAASREQLAAKLSQHRKKLAVDAARRYVLPRIAAP